MANIITYQNRRRMPAETSGVPLSRWDIANLSEPQKAAAQLGETLSNISFDIAKKFKDAKDLTDINAGEAQMHKSLISLYDQYSADPDYGTMIDRWNKDVDLTSKNILSNKGMSGTARKALEQQLNKISLGYIDNVTRLSRNKQDADGKDKHYAIVDVLLQNYALNAEEPDSFQKSQDEIFKRIDADAMAGYIDNPEQEKSKISKQMDVYKIDRYLNIDLAKAADEVEKSKTLDPGEKNNYRDRIKVRQNQLLNKAEEQLEIQWEKERGELYDLLHEGVLTREKIESTSLKEKEQQEFWKMVGTEAESRIKGEDTFLTDRESTQKAFGSLIDFYNGDKTKDEVLAETAEARFKDRTLSDKDYAWIKNNLDKDYPKEIVKGLEICKQITDNTQNLNDSSLTRFTQSILELIDKQIADKKTPSTEDIYIQIKKNLPFYLNNEVTKTEQKPRIKVKSPDGKIGTIPETQREDAVKEGYIIIE